MFFYKKCEVCKNKIPLPKTHVFDEDLGYIMKYDYCEAIYKHQTRDILGILIFICNVFALIFSVILIYVFYCVIANELICFFILLFLYGYFMHVFHILIIDKYVLTKNTKEI